MVPNCTMHHICFRILSTSNIFSSALGSKLSVFPELAESLFKVLTINNFVGYVFFRYFVYHVYHWSSLFLKRLLVFTLIVRNPCHARFNRQILGCTALQQELYGAACKDINVYNLFLNACPQRKIYTNRMIISSITIISIMINFIVMK